MVCESNGTHLDSSRKQMTVVRQPSRERRAVVEGELGAALGELQARLEGINVPPILDDLFLLLGKVKGRCDCRESDERKEADRKTMTHDRAGETTYLQP